MLTRARTHTSEEEETSILTNPVFGPLVESIHGANVAGVRNHVHIFEKGAEVVGQKTWKGCLGPRGYLWFCVNCCPKSEVSYMIPAHRFTDVQMHERSKCYGCCCCCCPTRTIITFNLTNDEEVTRFALDTACHDRDCPAFLASRWC